MIGLFHNNFFFVIFFFILYKANERPKNGKCILFSADLSQTHVNQYFERQFILIKKKTLCQLLNLHRENVPELSIISTILVCNC